MVEEKITGLMIYYYIVCKRKLWLSSNHINMELGSESVAMGKYIDESSYSRERKHLLINGEINIDYVKKNGTIHEIKKSRKIESASIWQVKYYLFYLKNLGVLDISAKIDYPLLKETLEVSLDENDIEKIQEMMEDIQVINSSAIPEIELSKKCNNCAYFDLCMI